MNQKVQAALIGCGGMAQHHLRSILKQLDTTQVIALCDPSPKALKLSEQKFIEAKLQPPPTWTSVEALLADLGDELDAVFIITPHAYHHDQTVACLEAGVDVLLEKPMAMNAAEARNMIKTRDRTGRLLVVAFQGSLSPEIRAAVEMLRSGELGEILNIHGVAWQGWKDNTTGAWRQNPALSGGGFMFDTGAHLLNTVADLAGEPFVEVAAWMDQRGTPVDILAAAMGRLSSGAMVTLSGCGDTIPSCSSDIRVFCRDGILQTGIWGGYLHLQRRGEKELQPVKCPPSLGSWQRFLAVRSGEIENPCPPEIGLRMAQLWDALQASAAQGGRPVTINNAL
jgi:predicted dehydrogenase